MHATRSVLAGLPAALLAALLAAFPASGAVAETPLVLSDAGIAGVTMETPFNRRAVVEAVGPDYQVSAGMLSLQGVTLPAYRVSQGDDPLFQILGPPHVHSRNEKILGIASQSAAVSTPDGYRVGTRYEAIFGAAAEVSCVAGAETEAGKLACVSPDGSRTFLIFGPPGGEAAEAPSDPAERADWQVESLLWRGSPPPLHHYH